MRPVLALLLLSAPALCAQEDAQSLARAVVDQVNWARQDPKAAADVLRTWLPLFEGDRYLAFPGEPRLHTQEGSAPVKEAIRFLERQKPLPPLRWSAHLASAAAELVKDQSEKGGLGHQGSDGSTPSARMDRHARLLGESGEVVTYGQFGDPPSPRRAVLALIVDDGVRDRGHRALLFNAAFTAAGAAWGPHPLYGRMAAVDLAEQILDEPPR
ncbi:MAG: CAP domain-containing protein [Acidobacteria bacterium]|nr:CAP domain-containing protein [Acidobacteriota bacterium]